MEERREELVALSLSLGASRLCHRFAFVTGAHVGERRWIN